MAGSLNKVMLIGNAGKDPEVRNTQQGGKIVNLTLATSETWNDKASGERKEKTEWHRVVIFNDRTADVAEKYVRKGSKIYIEGSLQTRKWTDQSGQERYSTEVVIGKFSGQLTLLDSRASQPERQEALPQDKAADIPWDAPTENPRTQPAPRSDGTRAAQARAATADLSDEIPF